jgi:lactate dehydrogenase-like 2-hydroxyacid dehydrogenase
LSIPKIVSFHLLPEKTLTSLFKDKFEPLTIVRAGIRGEISEEDACEAVRDATVIIAFPLSPFLSRKILEAAKHVKLVQNCGVGYDNIDIIAANDLGIPVANNPGWNSTSVAEHTIMLMLMTLKKTIYAHNKTVGEGWNVRTRVPELLDRTLELKDKTVGLIGMGAIGSEVARLANAFGAHIVYYKRNRFAEETEKTLGVEYRSFRDLLAKSDIVSLHVPLTDETMGLIGRDEIALMKKGAIIINTAREGILVECAAAEALESGKLSAAGLDVVKTRVVDGFATLDSPLVGFENVVFTPHQAGTTFEARNRSKLQWSENVIRVLNGEKPSFIVNDV